jgi:dihydroxy-acid dehydratase
MIREGEGVAIDIDARRIDLDVPPDELERRLLGWREPAPKYTRGVFAKYANSVWSASDGAVTLPRP